MNWDDIYSSWRQFKMLFQWTEQIHPTFFHFIYGIVIFGVAYFFLRRFRWGPVYAWLCVAVLEGLNEIIDVSFDLYRYNDIRVKGTALDIVATMLIPSFLAAVLIWRAQRINKDAASPK